MKIQERLMKLDFSVLNDVPLDEREKRVVKTCKARLFVSKGQANLLAKAVKRYEYSCFMHMDDGQTNRD